MIESWEDLATTTYGRLLIGKIVVVLLMMFLGALNRRCLKPQSAAEPEMLRTLRRNVAVESCLGAVVLLIVGVMGMTPPPG
jgi:putative copper export protein